MEELNNSSNYLVGVDSYLFEKMYLQRFGKIPCIYSKNYEDSVLEFNPESVDTITTMLNESMYTDLIVRYGEEYTRNAENHYSYKSYCEDPDHWGESYILASDKANMRLIIIMPSYVCVCYDSYSGLFKPKDFLDTFVEKLNLKKREVTNGYVNVIYQTPNGDFDTMSSKIKKTNIDLSTHYNDDFLPVHEKIRAFIDSNERRSGLVMLNGEPGTGKSYYIRHLINSVDRNFIIITPQMASCLSSAAFTNFLVANSDTTFILEDCEKILLDREKFGVSDSISSILNMSDGILSDVYACRFICTFNCDINSIDQAALRKGRCIAQYHFTKLSAEKANALLNELGYDNAPYKEMTLADIYNYGEDNNVVAKPRKKIGF